ncbi:uncharacterized protein LOC143460900 [Clavelina lepadiformis]|uniref:uncharacterized protein LOC143460900 n=1 Tax=Clavelina lepadiformis TaxID=159417 RepID=UPI0040433C13
MQFVVLFIFASALVVSAQEGCSSCQECSEKIDCGYYGIGEDECELRSCMWCPGEIDSEEPWCFHPWQPVDEEQGVCAIDGGDRIECGYYGINKTECTDNNCCWEEGEENSQAPWCFMPGKVINTPECSGCDNCYKKYDCGYYGMTEEECAAKGCLWCEAENEPSCFYSYPIEQPAGCDVEDDVKKDCGYFGIEESECVNVNNCCWAQSDTAGVPWCYNPSK